MSFSRPTTNRTHEIDTNSDDLDRVGRTARSGDVVRLVNVTDGRREQYAYLWIDYCTSDRVWWVKAWIGQNEEQSVEPVTESWNPIEPQFGFRDEIAGMIRFADQAIRNGDWIAP